MQFSGKMVFSMTLVAASMPFVFPQVIKPVPSPDRAVNLGDTHPAKVGTDHPADLGNIHPAVVGGVSPAATPGVTEAHPSFPNEVIGDENVTINPADVQGHVTFAFPRAAHVTIVLPDGVQFAVSDNRNANQALAAQQPATFPGFAPLVPPVLQTNIVLNPGASVATNLRSGNMLATPGMQVVTNETQNPINEAAGAQPQTQRRQLKRQR
jgi:hypothetical protein